MRLAVVILGLALIPAPLLAQQSGALIDADLIGTCLDQQADEAGHPETCIGQAAAQCMEADGGSTTPGMGACLAAERDVWDARLNATFTEVLDRARQADALMAESDPDFATQEASLRDMQRHWIAFRDAACTFERSRWTNGSMAGPAATGCSMRLTGQQAIWLEEFLQEGH